MVIAFVSLQERQRIQGVSEAEIQGVINTQLARLNSEQYRTAQGRTKSAISQEVQNITSVYRAELQRRQVQQQVESGRISQEAGQRFLAAQASNLQQSSRSNVSKLAESRVREARAGSFVEQRQLERAKAQIFQQAEISLQTERLAGEFERKRVLAQQEGLTRGQATTTVQTKQALPEPQRPASISGALIQPTGFQPKPKEFGGQIKEAFKPVSNVSQIKRAYQKIVEFEATKITPKLERFFEITPEQLEAEREREKTAPPSQFAQLFSKITGKPIKREKGAFEREFEEGFVKLAKFESRPITKVAPFVALGGAFKTVEFGLAAGAIKVKPVFEFITSPVGQKTLKFGKGALIGTVAVVEGVRVVKDPSEVGVALAELASFGVGARGVGGVQELPIVRESRIGSPFRRIQEVAGIKSITETTKAEAIRTSETPVSKEVREKGVVELQKELREASDIAQQIRGKFKPTIEKLTPEFLVSNLRRPISLPQAKRVVGLFEKFPSGSVFLKGSIVQPLQGIRKPSGVGDIDVAVRESVKSAFEIEALKVTKKTGVSFDIRTFEEGRQTATAQIEPLRETFLSSGKKIKLTGIVEQQERKIEGAIRFLTGAEGGGTRAKDVPEFSQIREGIERVRKKPVFGFEEKPIVSVRQADFKFLEAKSSRLLSKSVVEKRVKSSFEDLRKSVISRGKIPKASVLSKRFLGSVRPSSLPASRSIFPSISSKPSVSYPPSISSPPSIPSSKPPSKPRSIPSSKPPISSSFFRSGSRSFSGIDSSDFFRTTPPAFAPKIPIGLSEFGFGRSQRKRKLPSKYTPSLIGITRNIKFRGKLPKQLTGLEIRGLPVGIGRKPISLSQVFSKSSKSSVNFKFKL